MTGDAAARWRAALEAWAIPREILDQAPADPWELRPSDMREHRRDQSPTPSQRRAVEALAPGGDVLDVGAGRCAMSLPLRPPARRIVAVDASAAMLENSPADQTVAGRWPDVAEQAGRADVVVCGHVLYNVADLVPFVEALHGPARRRVVIEMTTEHPRGRPYERDLWRRLWGLERPAGPSWEDAVAVIRDCGIAPEHQLWDLEPGRAHHSLDDLVAAMRRATCLPASRDAEVRAVLGDHAVERGGVWLPTAEPRHGVTLWWDTGGVSR
jgi:hypothetical protein